MPYAFLSKYVYHFERQTLKSQYFFHHHMQCQTYLIRNLLFYSSSHMLIYLPFSLILRYISKCFKPSLATFSVIKVGISTWKTRQNGGIIILLISNKCFVSQWWLDAIKVKATQDKLLIIKHPSNKTPVTSSKYSITFCILFNNTAAIYLMLVRTSSTHISLQLNSLQCGT